MESMRKTVGNAAILSFIVAVAMTLVSMLGMRWLLTFMNTPEDIFDDAYTYIMIICGGIFTQVLYNLLSSILRALGNSKTPLYFSASVGRIEHCAGSGADHLFPYGSGRGCLCDRNFSGSFPVSLSDFYH